MVAIRRRQLKPAKKLEDPFIVGILIALAQYQRSASKLLSENKKTSKVPESGDTSVSSPSEASATASETTMSKTTSEDPTSFKVCSDHATNSSRSLTCWFLGLSFALFCVPEAKSTSSPLQS